MNETLVRYSYACKAVVQTHTFFGTLLSANRAGTMYWGSTPDEPSENVPENDPMENSMVPAYAAPRFPEKAESALNHHSVSSTPSADRSFGGAMQRNYFHDKVQKKQRKSTQQSRVGCQLMAEMRGQGSEGNTVAVHTLRLTARWAPEGG